MAHKWSGEMFCNNNKKGIQGKTKQTTARNSRTVWPSFSSSTNWVIKQRKSSTLFKISRGSKDLIAFVTTYAPKESLALPRHWYGKHATLICGTLESHARRIVDVLKDWRKCVVSSGELVQRGTKASLRICQLFAFKFSYLSVCARQETVVSSSSLPSPTIAGEKVP